MEVTSISVEFWVFISLYYLICVTLTPDCEDFSVLWWHGFFKIHCFCQREIVTSTSSPLFGPFKHPSLIQEKSIHGVGENLDSLAWAFLPVLSRPWALWEHVSLLCIKMSSFYGLDGLHRNVSLFLTYRSWPNQLNQLWNMENTSGDTDDN